MSELEIFQAPARSSGRAAPFRPEIDDHRTARLEHILLNVASGFVDHEYLVFQGVVGSGEKRKLAAQ